MSAERTLDGSLGASPGTYSWGWLTSPDGTGRICEATDSWTGPYDGYGYHFVDCTTGVRLTVTKDSRPHRWRPITRERLIAETGLDPGPFHDGNLCWHGGWFTKERRNPVMRALYRFCLDEAVACGPFELQSLLLVRDPEESSAQPRFNNTREFGSAVADRVDRDPARDLHAAIRAQFSEDVRLALALPAMNCAWRDSLDFSPGRPLNLWSGRLAMTVRLDRLADAAAHPRLLTHSQALVKAAWSEIESERVAAITEATGSYQAGLFADEPCPA